MAIDIRTAFEILKTDCGSHCAAALRLGFSAQHYRALRNGRVPIPARTAEFILLKAREAQAMAENAR